ncbi:MAG: hypothetical protein WBV94_34735 [Blastocatellia bacterium]
MQHRKKGHFILALPSRNHTDPNTGNSYRSFSVWKPEAPRAFYIYEAELNEKYQAVTPEHARDWWVRQYAIIPPIQTLETHIIGGAIIPLWQSFKTDRETRLRVVRVSTDAGQRIVGIHIPNDRVWRVLRSLGIGRRLQDPAQIYNAVLNEGDELTLVGTLKLKQGSLHGEAIIELHCTDPYKFAPLRELGLINEQIKWKQRFFIPADEDKGPEILAALLKVYPVSATEEATDEATEQEAIAEIEAMPESTADNVIDLEQWIIAAGEIEENKEQGSEESREVSASASIQTTLLQEPDESSQRDNRKPSDQRSLFGEPQPANEPESKRTKKKATGYSYQAQLTFDFSALEPTQKENMSATSQAA